MHPLGASVTNYTEREFMFLSSLLSKKVRMVKRFVESSEKMIADAKAKYRVEPMSNLDEWRRAVRALDLSNKETFKKLKVLLSERNLLEAGFKIVSFTPDYMCAIKFNDGTREVILRRVPRPWLWTTEVGLCALRRPCD